MDNQPIKPAAPAPPEPAPTPAAPPAEPAPSEPPKKKSKKGLVIGIIAGVVVLIAAIVVGGIFLFKNIMGAGSAEASAFVSDISNGRLQQAYERFSPQLKEVQDFDTFSYQIGTLGLDPSCEYKADSAEIKAGTSGNTKETAGNIECNSKSFTAEFKFVEINSQFKLYLYQITPKAAAENNNNSNSTLPKDVEALRNLILGRKAMNCTVTEPDGTVTLIQTNKNWTKFRLETEEGSFLYIQGEGMYSWSEDGAWRMDYDMSFLDDVAGLYDASFDEEEDYTGYIVSCNNASKADFSLPAGIEFEEVEMP